MKRLSILRHAKAAPHGSTGSDFDRPLAPRGREDVAAFREWARESLRPDLTLVSTALRTAETYDLLREGLGRELPARRLKELYLAELGDLLSVLQAIDGANDVLLVGHNPGLEELASLLAGRSLELPTCGFARFDLPIETWSELDRETEGTLVDLRV